MNILRYTVKIEFAVWVSVKAPAIEGSVHPLRENFRSLFLVTGLCRPYEGVKNDR